MLKEVRVKYDCRGFYISYSLESPLSTIVVSASLVVSWDFAFKIAVQE